MNADSELTAWREQWQGAQPMHLPGLRARVERQLRHQRLFLVGDILVTVLVGGFAAAWALRVPEPDILVLAFAVWGFIGIAWAFALVNRRGTWASSASSATAFLDLSIRRCRAAIATTSFGMVLGLVELVFSVAWVYQHLARRGPLPFWTFATSPALPFAAACALAGLVGLVWYRRRKQAELASLLDLQRQIAAPGDLDVPRKAKRAWVPLIVRGRQKLVRKRRRAHGRT